MGDLRQKYMKSSSKGRLPEESNCGRNVKEQSHNSQIQNITIYHKFFQWDHPTVAGTGKSQKNPWFCGVVKV